MKLMYDDLSSCLLPGSLTPECVTTSCELIIENDFQFRKFPECAFEYDSCHLSHSYTVKTQPCLPEYECVFTVPGKSEGDGLCTKTTKVNYFNREKDCDQGDCQAVEDQKPDFHRVHEKKVLSIQT